MKVALLVIVCVASVLAHPSPQAAATCDPSKCLISSDCRCSSDDSPLGDSDAKAPQLIALTVSESLVKTLYDDYLKPLLYGRKNSDGNPIGATFYVNHRYTDYTLVQDLYLNGFEIGVHSVTKNSSQKYWREDATSEDLIEEFADQRQIIANFANIPIEDITGARTPELQLRSDVSIDAYIQAELLYDNSWPTLSTKPLYPYTLDYASSQQCTVTMTCPTESHDGFWIAPITNIRGTDDVECNSFPTCAVNGTTQQIYDWLVGEVDRHQLESSTPLSLRLDSYWFLYYDNSLEAFTQFLDTMNKRTDVFLVSVSDAIAWTKNPVSLDQYRTPVYDSREADCYVFKCDYVFNDGDSEEPINMNSCIPCPKQYPWKGNPLGQIQT